MGTAESRELRIYDPNDLTTWRLAHAEAVFERFAAQNYDFGLDQRHLELLLSEAVPGISTLADVLWETFAHESSPQDGREQPRMCNALEVLMALGCATNAPLMEKVTAGTIAILKPAGT